MRVLCAATMFGLLSAAAGEQPKDGKATVQLTGQLTADKGATVSYTLKKGGKVIAEEKNLTSLPSKGVEVPAADAAGPLELRVSAEGVVKVAQVGVTVTAGGKTRKWVFGGRPFDLNVKDPSGASVRAITLTATPEEVAEPKKKPDEPKKLPEDIKKKPEETKKKPEERKPSEKPPAAPPPHEK